MCVYSVELWAECLEVFTINFWALSKLIISGFMYVLQCV